MFRNANIEVRPGRDFPLDPIPGGKPLAARRADLVIGERRLEVKNFTTNSPHTNSPRIMDEMNRDVMLRQQGEAKGIPYLPEWHFVGQPPTKDLQDALTAKGIPFFIYET